MAIQSALVRSRQALGTWDEVGGAWLLTFQCLGPELVLVKGKDTAQQILVENVLKKSPVYDGFRPDRHHADIFTERDKDAHKHRVST